MGSWCYQLFSGVCLGVTLSENHQQADNHEIKIMEWIYGTSVVDHGQDQRSQLIPAIGTRKMSRTCYMLKCWLQVRQKVLLIVHNPCNRKNVPAGHLKIYRFSLFDAFISFIKVDCACCLYSWRTFPITKVVHAACIHGVLKFSITY